jgi:hypothetical protein
MPLIGTAHSANLAMQLLIAFGVIGVFYLLGRFVAHAIHEYLESLN